LQGAQEFARSSARGDKLLQDSFLTVRKLLLIGVAAPLLIGPLAIWAGTRVHPAADQAAPGRPSPASGYVEDSCGKLTPRDCAALALEAMGGRARLEGIKSIYVEVIGHTALTEQSYRQDPFITSYERAKETLDLAGGRIRREAQMTWPESDLGQSDSNFTMVAGPNRGVYKFPKGDRACTLSDLDETREALALGPARLLLTALESTDLRFEAPETLRSTPHTTLTFTWRKTPVRILLNRGTHLPDAIETVRQFQDFWFYWGDVRQRIYFDNWMLIHGVVYPTNTVEERNGTIWKSTQALNVRFDVPVDDTQFAMDEKAAAQSSESKGFNRPFGNPAGTSLAPGVDLFPGSWNATLIKQDDGVVILEAPLSGSYVHGLVEKAGEMYPGAPIKAVLSTSDSWPHVGGVRQSVALGFPVYILDLNRPLLDRFIAAPHTLEPDALATSPKKPDWRIVSGKVEIGRGENRVELYPLRGSSTERQYVVYFPAHSLLYASDTLVINSDGTLYDPELTYEVFQAVKREGLQVTTVFAMHQAPVAWTRVLSLIQKASEP